MRPLAKRKLPAVALGVGDVADAAAIDVAGCAWAKRLARATAPVVDVVLTGTRRQFGDWDAGVPREVGHLVLNKTGGISGVDQLVVHRACHCFIDIKLASLQLFVKRCVLLVDHLIAGEVFTTHGDRLGHGGFPDCHRLTGDGEHEVEVDVVKAGGAQPVKRFEHHLARVDSAEPLKQALF